MQTSIAPIHIDLDSKTLLFRQVADSIRFEIESGRLPAGAKLPSTRNLAVHLKVSRATTSAAYRELVRLGLIESPDHGGTYVRHTLTHHGTSDALNFSPDECDERDNEDPAFSALSREPIRTGPDTSADAGFVDASRLPSHLLPLKKWNQYFYTRHPSSEDKLRHSLASYLKRARSVVVAPQQIVVFGNQRQALFAVNSILLQRDDIVAIEHPIEPAARASFQAQGSILVPLESDGNGIVVDHLKDLREVKLTYTSPSNQHPSGTALSLERRHSLLNYARERKMLIVENDSDHEITYRNRTVPALKSLDQTNHVIYIGSFSKSLSPLTDIAFVVAPPSLVPALRQFSKVSGSDAPAMEQHALACMLESGHLERHFYQLRPHLSENRRKLIESLAQSFGQSASLLANAIGTILCVRFAFALPACYLQQAALKAGLPILDASKYYGAKEESSQLLISIAHVDTGSVATSIERFSQSVVFQCVSAKEDSHRNGAQIQSMPEDHLDALILS